MLLIVLTFLLAQPEGMQNYYVSVSVSRNFYPFKPVVIA